MSYKQNIIIFFLYIYSCSLLCGGYGFCKDIPREHVSRNFRCPSSEQYRDAWMVIEKLPTHHSFSHNIVMLPLVPISVICYFASNSYSARAVSLAAALTPVSFYGASLVRFYNQQYHHMPQEIIDAADDIDLIPVDKELFFKIVDRANNNRIGGALRTSLFQPSNRAQRKEHYLIAALLKRKLKLKTGDPVMDIVNNILDNADMTCAAHKGVIPVTEKDIVALLPYLKCDDITELLQKERSAGVVDSIRAVIEAYNHFTGMLLWGWIRCNKPVCDKNILGGTIFFYRPRYFDGFLRNSRSYYAHYGPRFREVIDGTESCIDGDAKRIYLFEKDSKYRHLCPPASNVSDVIVGGNNNVAPGSLCTIGGVDNNTQACRRYLLTHH
ncbi:MAG: hypothetical protein WC707_05530 [Candidatus Babeliaceae bacterium]